MLFYIFTLCLLLRACGCCLVSGLLFVVCLALRLLVCLASLFRFGFRLLFGFG